MKAVLISIKPEYCELIASEKKTIEIRKTHPRFKTPFKCYIYCTQASPYNKSVPCHYKTVNGYYSSFISAKVIGEFICDDISKLPPIGDIVYCSEYKKACLSVDKIKEYAKGKQLYGWHISNLKIYDKPKELSEFYVAYKKAKNECSLKEKTKEGTICIATESICRGGCWKKSLIRPPQSWCYVNKVE